MYLFISTYMLYTTTQSGLGNILRINDASPVHNKQTLGLFRARIQRSPISSNATTDNDI